MGRRHALQHEGVRVGYRVGHAAAGVGGRACREGGKERVSKHPCHSYSKLVTELTSTLVNLLYTRAQFLS